MSASGSLASGAYDRVFVRPWSPYAGALSVMAIVIALLGQDLFWGVVGGLRLWGDHLNQALGLGALLGLEAPLSSPLQHRLSLMDIALVLGAAAAALLARQFRLRRAPPLEYLTGAVGGTLMGVGAALAGGCTVGGFFVPVLLTSAAGWSMWLGLGVGAFLGLRSLAWLWTHVRLGTAVPRRGLTSHWRWSPAAGIFVAGTVGAWAFVARTDPLLPQAGVSILAGFALGFVLQRSRLCIVRAFREPFLTGDPHHTYVLILALAIGAPLTAALVQTRGIDVWPAIPATFWAGSLIGGVVFGMGMVWAGGCGAGALWRAGEGHLKLWVALLFFSWSRSIAGGLLRAAGAFTPSETGASPLGYAAYLPDMLGWHGAYLLTFTLLLVWYWLVHRNLAAHRLALAR